MYIVLLACPPSTIPKFHWKPSVKPVGKQTDEAMQRRGQIISFQSIVSADAVRFFVLKTRWNHGSLLVCLFVSWFQFANWLKILQNFLSSSQTGGFAHGTEHIHTYAHLLWNGQTVSARS